MLVAEILKDKGDAVYHIRPDARLGDACGELDRLGVGALIVCDEDRVVGVVSERDVVRAVARDGGAALDRPVSDIMTADVVFAAPVGDYRVRLKECLRILGVLESAHVRRPLLPLDDEERTFLRSVLVEVGLLQGPPAAVRPVLAR